MYTLVFTKSHYKTLMREAARDNQVEICGLVGGTWHKMVAVAQRLVAVPNIARQPQVEFRMAPEIQVQTMLDFEDSRLSLVAIYHSHPKGPPYPSVRDIREHSYPDSLSVIISPNEDSVTAWRIVRGDVLPVKINTHPQ